MQDNLQLVNYLHSPVRGECRLPNSLGIASDLVDFLRPEVFCLTSPPWAEVLVPNTKSRKPSFLILTAALINRESHGKSRHIKCSVPPCPPLTRNSSRHLPRSGKCRDELLFKVRNYAGSNY